MITREDDLIKRAAYGDQEAFRQLWENHHAVAMASALRLCHQRNLAEEITQGAFLLAWRGLRRTVLAVDPEPAGGKEMLETLKALLKRFGPEGERGASAT